MKKNAYIFSCFLEAAVIIVDIVYGFMYKDCPALLIVANAASILVFILMALLCLYNRPKTDHLNELLDKVHGFYKEPTFLGEKNIVQSSNVAIKIESDKYLSSYYAMIRDIICTEISK
ncbi:MAG: hypothetical protein MJ174_05475 [Treponema sp.]|nr:hypothetical protein [Treponema sp.]